MKKSVIYILLALLVSACGDDLMTGGRQYYYPESGVFVCNEGNFMYGNAALTYYDPSSREVENQIFYNANNFPLGDVCQSMEIINGRGYVVVNNSGVVYVIDPITFKYLGKISGLTSPRFIMGTGSGKLYVTEYYSPSIKVVDEATLSLIGEISLPVQDAGAMVRVDGYVYVCASDSPCVVCKIDASNEKLVASTPVTLSPNSIVVDKNKKLWVLSDGGYYGSPLGQEVAAISRINPSTMQVEKVLTFPSINDSPYNLRINGAGDKLYYVSYNVYAMGIDDGVLPVTPFVAADAGQMYYGIGVEPSSGDVYITDAVDYMQKGKVLRYSKSGEKIDSFTADIIPGAFCFKKK